MGLLYVFPVSLDETDFVIKQDNQMTVKTYGLPYIFWIYAFACVAVVFFMFLAIKAPLLKLASLGDETDATLAYSLLSAIGVMPVAIFSFFFYEKRIVRKDKTLSLEYRLFGLRVFKESFEVATTDDLKIESFLTSPNVARLKNEGDSQGFQNKGYYVLWLYLPSGKRILIDRHSRKVDLEKLKSLIS